MIAPAIHVAAPEAHAFELASRSVRLAVQVWGDRDPRRDERPTLVLVHGYPDTSAVWEPIARQLAADYRVVTYDVRGAGGSTAPPRDADYALAELVRDLAAVIDATAARPVHLVGHDWGSIQSWEAVTDPVFAHRLASFTSISGPCLDHVAHTFRARVRTRPGDVLRVASRSWYMGAFHLPFAKHAWRVIGPAWPRIIERLEGVAAAPGDRQRDGVAGMALYRANVVRRMVRPQTRETELPIQLVVPLRDPFVRPALLAQLARWAPNTWRRDVVAGHWQVLADAPLVARWMREWIEHVDRGRTSAVLKRARLGDPRRQPRERPAFAGKLAVVTGAGSGIGRATAIELAALGAEIVAADLDFASARVTAELAALVGARAHARAVDVADAAAMARFAAEVRRELGVPDIVVNNAGIAVAGGLLATTDAEWERVFAVNVSGVARGCRLFAAQMVEERRAGHIVNIASAAAFAPSRVLPAYASSKAAVVMLGDCLRGELAAHGIGVSTICPGFIDTAITSATRFAGEEPAAEAARRRATARMYRRRGLTAEHVARVIVDAIERDQPLAYVGVEATALHWIHRFAPGLARRLAAVDLDRGARKQKEKEQSR